MGKDGRWTFLSPSSSSSALKNLHFWISENRCFKISSTLDNWKYVLGKRDAYWKQAFLGSPKIFAWEKITYRLTQRLHFCRVYTEKAVGIKNFLPRNLLWQGNHWSFLIGFHGEDAELMSLICGVFGETPIFHKKCSSRLLHKNIGEMGFFGWKGIFLWEDLLLILISCWTFLFSKVPVAMFWGRIYESNLICMS